MQATTRRKLAMATRALEFVQAHPSSDAGYSAIVARLAADVARGDILAQQENAGRLSEQSATEQRAELRVNMQTLQLKHLVNVGNAAARTHRELAHQFVLPTYSGPQHVFITAAKVLLANATAAKEILLPLGLGDGFLDGLTASIAAFDATSETGHNGRRDHVGARTELTTVVQDCMECVNLLDGLIRAAYPRGGEEIGAWQSARNVAGPFRHDVVPPPAIAA